MPVNILLGWVLSKMCKLRCDCGNPRVATTLTTQMDLSIRSYVTLELLESMCSVVHISCLHTCPLIQFANILSSVHMFRYIEITWFPELRKRTYVPPFLSAFNPFCLLSYLLVGFLVQKPPRVNMTEPTGNCVAWIIWEQEIFDRNHELLHIKCTKPSLNTLYLYNIVWEDSYENIKSFWGVTGFVSVGSGNGIEAVWPWHLWY